MMNEKYDRSSGDKLSNTGTEKRKKERSLIVNLALNRYLIS